jgi:hypothetical protein
MEPLHNKVKKRLPGDNFLFRYYECRVGFVLPTVLQIHRVKRDFLLC